MNLMPISMPTKPAEIVPLLAMSPAKDEILTTSIPSPPARIVPALATPPETTESPSNAIPVPNLPAEIMPRLLMPPKTLVTNLTAMPLKLPAIVPLFVMPPPGPLLPKTAPLLTKIPKADDP